ncbi:MAG: 5'-methylthioadenosine/adenosylhomocysteine nucleosidase [Prevotella sp.]|nr:5'-methylthioadenosine/adenosylhomocysteine nucleosidase [Staphylococcus sp.]MCM1349974.1 5'-methylthioadenosine/adenosylhomocysteine nucleosidase [Prevotella sp.]
MRTIGIIVAMHLEMMYLQNQVESIQTKVICNHTFYEGTYHQNKIVFTTAGIGKVNAGVTTILMIEHYQPTVIVNTGIAGGYYRDLKPLDIVIASRLLYADVDMTSEIAGGYSYGQMEGLPPYFMANTKWIKKSKKKNRIFCGDIITGDQFVDNYERVDTLVKQNFPQYNILAVDMESCAIAHVCTMNQIECIVIRSISDVIGKTNEMDYQTFSKLAADQACQVVLEMIEAN